MSGPTPTYLVFQCKWTAFLYNQSVITIFSAKDLKCLLTKQFLIQQPLDLMSEISCRGELLPRPWIKPATSGLLFRSSPYWFIGIAYYGRCELNDIHVHSLRYHDKKMYMIEIFTWENLLAIQVIWPWPCHYYRKCGPVLHLVPAYI